MPQPDSLLADRWRLHRSDRVGRCFGRAARAGNVWSANRNRNRGDIDLVRAPDKVGDHHGSSRRAISLRADDEGIISSAAGEGIDAAEGIKLVIALVPLHEVRSWGSRNGVVAKSSDKRVGATKVADVVVATIAEDEIVSKSGLNLVRPIQ